MLCPFLKNVVEASQRGGDSRKAAHRRVWCGLHWRGLRGSDIAGGWSARGGGGLLHGDGHHVGRSSLGMICTGGGGGGACTDGDLHGLGSALGRSARWPVCLWSARWPVCLWSARWPVFTRDCVHGRELHWGGLHGGRSLQGMIYA